MNIVIVGGDKKVDFLVNSLLKKKHHITVISENEADCKAIARAYDIEVVCGDGSKPFILEDAGVKKADLMIALTPNDADNLVICQLAKLMFSVKRAFATVTNPKNVDVFKKLGINTVISATHMLVGIIEQMASVDEVTNYMPIENGKIQFVEFVISRDNANCGKKLMDIKLPENTVVGCVFRDDKMLIPNGRTQILAEDKLTVLFAEEVKSKVLSVLLGGR